MATLFALPPEAGSVAHDMLRRARIPTRLVGSWQELERAAPESNVLVLAVPRLNARDVLARLLPRTRWLLREDRSRWLHGISDAR